MKELGKILKEARERRQFTIETMASRTKIHAQTLQDMEDGHREALPPKVFCVGLIKSYARELELDEAPISELCRKAFNEPEKPHKSQEAKESDAGSDAGSDKLTGSDGGEAEPEEKAPEVKAPSPTPPPQTPSSPAITPQPAEEPELTMNQDEGVGYLGRFRIPRTFRLVAGLLLSMGLLLTILAVIDKMNSYSMERRARNFLLPSREGRGAGNQVVPAQWSKEEPPPPPGVKASPQDQRESLQEKNEKREEEKQERGDKKKLFKGGASSLKPLKKESLPGIKNKAKGAAQGGGGNRAKEEATGSDHKLSLVALEPVRLEVVWSDGYVQVMLLKSQESKTFVFSKPITLRINNGGAVQVSFNDGGKKIPGVFNQPIEIKYP